jgi:class 3 adenylate cyclase
VPTDVTDWSDVGLTKKLSTEPVTLLMANVEHPPGLWDTEPEEIAALPWLRATIAHVVALEGGVLRGGQDVWDRFVVRFDRASDAVACALYLQLTPLDPFELRIVLHSIETRVDEDAHLIGVRGAARLRNIVPVGQTVVSGATVSLAADRLPPGASLKDLGDYSLGDLECRDRLFQLCHPGLPTHFLP